MNNIDRSVLSVEEMNLHPNGKFTPAPPSEMKGGFANLDKVIGSIRRMQEKPDLERSEILILHLGSIVILTGICTAEPRCKVIT